MGLNDIVYTDIGMKRGCIDNRNYHLYMYISACFVYTVNVLKFRALYFIYFDLNFAHMLLFLKILSEMANRVDSDQTALLAYVILSETLMYEIYRTLS